MKVLAALLMKGGFEVTYLGLYNTPEMVVQSALDEDALLKMGVKEVFCGSLVGDVVAYLDQCFGQD